MANASERNRRALNRLIREREDKREREEIRAAGKVIKSPTSSKDQKYRARRKLRLLDLAREGVIGEASQWSAYRLNYPNPLTRTKANAEAFLSGFGSPGESGTRNQWGGFAATSKQRRDRQTYIDMTTREARRLSTGVKDFGTGWWNVWREDYSNNIG